MPLICMVLLYLPVSTMSMGRNTLGHACATGSCYVCASVEFFQFDPGGPLMTASPATAQKPSLYERLGGVYSIAAVVDDFIDRIMVDPGINANPAVDEAHHRVSKAGFKYLVTEMVCWAAGGPQKYSGRSMAESHKDLGITGDEWSAFLDDLQQALDKFAVPPEEQAELKAIVDSTRSEIVVGDTAVRLSA